MRSTEVRNMMDSDQIVMIEPEATLQEAAQKMKQTDCGFLPVGTREEPQGVITDRDIVIRAISEGRDPQQEKVRDYMTTKVCSCRDSDMIEEAADEMHRNRVSRLLVHDEEGKICGVLTLGHILRTDGDREHTGEIVERAAGRAA